MFYLEMIEGSHAVVKSSFPVPFSCLPLDILPDSSTMPQSRYRAEYNFLGKQYSGDQTCGLFIYDLSVASGTLWEKRGVVSLRYHP